MTKKPHKFKRQLTPLKADEYQALKASAEADMRLSGEQARYLIVEGLKSRGLLVDTATALGRLVTDVVRLAESLEVTPKRIQDMVTKEAMRRLEEEDYATSKLAG